MGVQSLCAMPVETSMKTASFLETRRPLGIELIVKENMTPPVRTRDQIIQDMKDSYSLSPTFQAEFPSAEAFVESALPEVLELEEAELSFPENSTYHITLSRMACHAEHTQAATPDAPRESRMEVVQFINQKAEWDTWTFDHSKQSIAYSVERSCRYADYLWTVEPEITCIYNWILSKKEYESTHDGQSWLQDLCQANAGIEIHHSHWLLSQAPDSDRVKLTLTLHGEPVTTHTIELSLADDTVRLMLKQVHSGKRIQTWKYEYASTEAGTSSSVPHHVQYTLTDQDYPSAKLTREMTIQPAFSPDQWDAKAVLDQLLQQYSSYSMDR